MVVVEGCFHGTFFQEHVQANQKDVSNHILAAEIKASPMPSYLLIEIFIRSHLKTP